MQWAFDLGWVLTPALPIWLILGSCGLLFPRKTAGREGEDRERDQTSLGKTTRRDEPSNTKLFRIAYGVLAK